MATKGTNNFFSGFQNLFSKPSPADKKHQDKQDITKSHQSEKEMKALLGKIDLGNPQNLLSPEKVKELNIAGVIKYAESELKYPLVTDYDLTNLDNNMKFIINALDAALKQGLEATAEWACIALVFAVKNLRTQVDGIDTEWADALWECRVEYSENLKLLVQSSIEQDRLTSELAEQHERRQKDRDDLDQRKSSYQSRRDAGKLDLLLAEMEQKAHNPAALSDAAKALRDELFQIHLLKASLIEIDAAIDAKQVTLNGTLSEIKSRRNTLSSPPRVTDPKLQDKINEANRRYRDSLRRQLNEAEEALRSHDVHISAMGDLANHSVHITTVAKAIEMDKAMQLEKLQQLQLQQQANAIHARAVANTELIRNSIEVLEPIVETIPLTVEESIEEPIVETEEEVLTVTEYD